MSIGATIAAATTNRKSNSAIICTTALSLKNNSRHKRVFRIAFSLFNTLKSRRLLETALFGIGTSLLLYCELRQEISVDRTFCGFFLFPDRVVHDQ
jgi:hypothetical protein